MPKIPDSAKLKIFEEIHKQMQVLGEETLKQCLILLEEQRRQNEPETEEIIQSRIDRQAPLIIQYDLESEALEMLKDEYGKDWDLKLGGHNFQENLLLDALASFYDGRFGLGCC